MIQRGESKYLWASDGRSALYDLARDPLETTNLAASKPQLVAELDRRLKTWMSDQPPYRVRVSSRPARPMDERSIERLKRLGYMN